MSDPADLLTLASAGLIAVTMASAAALRGWSDWLDVRRMELERRRPHRPADLSELRRRVRRLEAIADGTRD